MVDPYNLVVAKDGYIYVVDTDSYSPQFGKQAVIEVNPMTGTQTLVSSGGYFETPTGIALDSSGNIIVGDRGYQAYGADGLIIKVNPATGVQTLLSEGGSLWKPDHIAVDSKGNILAADHDAYYDGTYAGGVTLVNPVTGAQTAVSYGYFQGGPVGIALDGSGDIFVSDNDSGDIYRIDQQTGREVVVSSGCHLLDPYALVYVSSVPMPSSLVLLCTGILGLQVIAFWNRRARPVHQA